ncbi:DUF222 domain-containing protein [Dermatobacter hominis]|uniref:DUF222 domain-containing protein n=1 Tax=Dermatobacter hominis TaxID=2884263 RepID=UPI001D111311|nr:DUF222 domain-containing protein [Dermatobacter hominis]UDY36434.1 13E12 repeat family protein [Dermatobacter hominis]
MPDDRQAATGADWAARILAAGGGMDTARRRLIAALAPFDASGEWARKGARTCAHWVAEHLRVNVGTAREWLRISKALVQLPEVAAAYAAGQLSYASVRTLTRIAVDHLDRQAELIGLVADLPCDDVAAALAGWCGDNEDPDTADERHRRRTGYWRTVEPDGMGRIVVRAPMIAIQAIHTAVDLRVRQGIVPAGDRSSLARQRALALEDLMTNGPGAIVDTQVVLHVRADGCTLHDGTPVASHAVAQLVPTAMIRALIHDVDGKPIDATNTRRHPTARQRAVIDERTPTCIDCGSAELLEYDHDPPFSETGHTVTDQTRQRCAPCHRAFHEREPTARGRLPRTEP